MKILVKRGKNGSLGVVLEALGVAPGGIWAPKSQNLKKGQKSEFEDPPPRDPYGRPKSELKVTWEHFLSFFFVFFLEVDFLIVF